MVDNRAEEYMVKCKFRHCLGAVDGRHHPLVVVDAITITKGLNCQL